MWQELLEAVNDIPEYVHAVIYGPHLVYAVAAGVIFVIVLLITNRFTAVLRKIFVYASIAIAVFAFVTKRYALFWLSIGFLLILLIFRFIRYAVVTIRENMRNKKIERKALAKAEERRGSFEKKQGFSGEARPADLSDTADSGHAENGAPQEHTAAPHQAELSRSEMQEAISMLRRLKELGIITEAEMAEKSAIVYEKLG